MARPKVTAPIMATFVPMVTTMRPMTPTMIGTADQSVGAPYSVLLFSSVPRAAHSIPDEDAASSLQSSFRAFPKAEGRISEPHAGQ